jgi:hypothetical protein
VQRAVLLAETGLWSERLLLWHRQARVIVFWMLLSVWSSVHHMAGFAMIWRCASKKLLML